VLYRGGDRKLRTGTVRVVHRNIAISLNPLTTGTSSLSNASGLFCPGQTATQHGAFGIC